MPSYVRIFSVSNVGQIHREYLRAIQLARRIEQTYARAGQRTRAAAAGAALREIQRSYADFNEDLDAVAKQTAVTARNAIKREIANSRVRPDTGNGPHLRDMIRARPLHRFGPLATGEVGVADIEVLDALVNPNSREYGPYWRSQEYGYQPRGKQLSGVRGGFYTAGFGAGPFRADSAYAGTPGPHPLFLAGKGGLVKFVTPLKPRRFIEKGAAAAEAAWRVELAAIEHAQEARLRALTSPAALAGLGGRRA